MRKIGAVMRVSEGKNDRMCGECDLNARTSSRQNLKSCAVVLAWLSPHEAVKETNNTRTDI